MLDLDLDLNVDLNGDSRIGHANLAREANTALKKLLHQLKPRSGRSTSNQTHPVQHYIVYYIIRVCVRLRW